MCLSAKYLKGQTHCVWSREDLMKLVVADLKIYFGPAILTRDGQVTIVYGLQLLPNSDG